MLVFLIRWIVMFISRNPDLKKRRKMAVGVLISMITIWVSALASFMTAVRQYTRPPKLDKLPRLTVTSDDLQGGVWSRDIGARNGNLSPSLSWTPYAGCKDYAVFMIDETAQNWLHLAGASESSAVKKGYFDRYSYVGPYPPSGTHTYTVYVFALKSPASAPRATLDTGGLKMDELLQDINSSVYVEYNNIAAVGTLSGTYSADPQ
ncbi:MAG: hypothetical protein J5842_02020 [Lachnospiraceae bacterium]|nr:hypothetical protein [Lachnospiraceae bacterium]